MSAIICVTGRDTVRIFADSAMVSMADGVLAGIGEKVNRWRDRPMALAVLSNNMAMTNAEITERIFPAIVGKTVDQSFAALEGLTPPLRASANSGAIVLIAGILANGTARTVIMATGENDAGVPAWSVTDASPLIVLGRMTEDHSELSEGALLASPQQNIGRWYSAFRKPGSQPFATVGGQIQMTTVTASGCTVDTVGYFPDWLGKPIDPTRKFVPVLR